MTLNRRLQNRILSLEDFEPIARRRLPRPLYGYVAGGCENGVSLRLNRETFDRYELQPRVLVDISQRSQAITLFGQQYSAPFGIAPMGVAAMTSYRGDILLAEAAQQAEIPAIMSGWSLIRLEEVAQAAPRTWFQAYLSRERADIDGLLARVSAAGFETLVITVDTPASANRENNVRNGYSTPLRPSLRLAWQGLSHPRWLSQVFLRTLLRHGVPHFENWSGTRGSSLFARQLSTSMSNRGNLCWEDIARIRRQWRGRLVLKGVLHPADAGLAHQHGVDGIIVSNHGGRQLDSAATPLGVLPSIVERFPAGPVMLDSGVRRGTDIIKALALGAACVFVGRPFNFAAAVAGAAGVAHGIDLLRQEVSRNMAMMGLPRLDQLGPDCLLPRS